MLYDVFAAADRRLALSANALQSQCAAMARFPDARALFIHMPTREQALEAQKANLLRFVRDNAEAFDALPYEPFTRPRPRFGLQTTIIVSSIPDCVGLRGVALVKDLITLKKEKPICYYPGLLITEKLHVKFTKQYYCPTSLQLKEIRYREPGAATARPLLILGDPTSHGALINDGVRSKQHGQPSGTQPLQKFERSQHDRNLAHVLVMLLCAQPTAC